MRPAVFLDRDGTIIEEAGYLDSLERIVLFPFSSEAIRLLNRAGLAVVVVSNQSGVGRGLLSDAFVREAHAHLAWRMEASGARLDAFYYCPHHPQAVVESLRVACECRKPAPGLLRQAAADLDLDLSRSFAVGDRWGDVGAGRAVGAAGLLVRTGYGRAAEAAPPHGMAADAIVDNLAAAAAWILQRTERG
jgi:D-glycero-D-manno-heptose 1,7-bisphosphate phosphatase